MATTEALLKEQQDLALGESIRQKRHCVLTHHGASGWRTFKSAFAAGSPHVGQLTVRGLPLDDEAPRIPTAGVTLGVTFRLGHKKCMFCSQLLSVRIIENEATMVMTWPDKVQQLRRRAYERAAPPADHVVAVRFWSESSSAEQAANARTVRHGQLEDISCGGLRMKVANAGDLQIAATYKCVFAPRPGKPSILVEGILRHREAIEHGRASLGFQFVGLETTPDGLKTLDRLARIVGHFQRAQSRR